MEGELDVSLATTLEIHDSQPMLIESLTPSQLRRTIQRLHVAKGGGTTRICLRPAPAINHVENIRKIV